MFATYWLTCSEHGSVGSVREKMGQNANTIRRVAIARAERNPGIFTPPGVLPETHRQCLRYADVTMVDPVTRDERIVR